MVKKSGACTYEEGMVDGIATERERVIKIVGKLGSQETRLRVLNNDLNLLSDIVEEVINEVKTGRKKAQKNKGKN